MKRLKFNKSWGIYNGGDVASFPEHTADALCSGPSPVASLVDAPANASVEGSSRLEAKRDALALKSNRDLTKMLASAGKSTKGNKAALVARLLGEEE